MDRIVIIEPSLIVQQGLKALLSSGAGAGALATGAEFKIAGIFENVQSFREAVVGDFDIMVINPAIVNFYKQFVVRSLFPDFADKTFVALIYGYVDSNTLNSFDGVIDIYDHSQLIAKKIRKAVESNTQSEDGNGEGVEISEREKEILTAVARGMTNKEIADKYNISAHTVVSHRKNITRKTGIKTVSGLTLYAVFNNLISEEDI